MTTETRFVTAEGLLELPRGQHRYELVQGELRKMAPAGHEHGHIAAEVAIALGVYVRANKLGRVYAAETGFKLASNPDTVKAPDVAFVSAERVQGVITKTGFFPGPPDLAVEIVSPNDRHGEVEEQVELWLRYGTKMVVTLNPQTRTATVYRGLEDIRMILGEGRLEGGEVVPGWALPLEELFNPAL